MVLIENALTVKHGSVGAAETNCESDKHVKCPKCSTQAKSMFLNLLYQPEKHKQENEEILERKEKLANVEKRISRKVIEPESHHLAKSEEGRSL